MHRLSVVIITLNEEENIGRCIDSVIPVADEILVVDSYSTDRTEEICREKGARFMQHIFEDYVSQHIFADRHATHDMILSLDADEALSIELSQAIIEMKAGAMSDGYYMNRKTNYCGKWISHSGWYPDRKLRLYNRRKGSWEGLKIHERFILHRGASSGTLKGDILHYSYGSVSSHISQAEKFTTITAQVAYEKGKKAGLLMIAIKPFFKFLRDYFMKMGFLDGYYGFVICRISAFATFLKYVKLRELKRKGIAKSS
ncbi:MAG: glycosyltransferase family 2 protein [Bacteroidales bacterium]|nr:glycosyltransferase family 2 protein [Bacteroidales bacterium]